MKTQNILQKGFLSIGLYLFTLTVTNAQVIENIGAGIRNINSSIVAAVATLFMALAATAFFFGMAMFIWASREGREQEIRNGRQFMLWSVVALFVMFSIYGIIRFGQGIIGIEGKTDIVIPSFRIGGGSGGSSQLPGGGPANPSNGSPLPGGGAGGGNGCSRAGDICYTCGYAACTCDESKACVFDYNNPNTTTQFQTTCTQSGGTWQSDEGCICPADKPYDQLSAQCVRNNSTNPNDGWTPTGGE